MTERILLSALRRGLGRAYGHAGAHTTDCVRLVADILADVYGPLPPQVRRDVLIAHDDPGRPWSGIEGLTRGGYGREVAEPVPGAWHFVQRWRGLVNGRIARSRGHAWLWHGGSGGMIIEATPVRSDWCRIGTWAEVCGAGEVRLVRLEVPRG